MAVTQPADASGLGQDKQTQLWIAILVTLSIAVVAVSLRLLASALSTAKLWLDDWLIIAAILNLGALNGFAIIAIKEGLGLGGPGTAVWIHDVLKRTFYAEFLYTTLLCFVKFSILAFYWRTFDSKITRWSIGILTIITSVWGLGLLATYLLQCKPIEEFWVRSNPALCSVSEKPFIVFSAIPNIVTDVGLLALPLYHIWTIQKNKSQKIALSCVFALGGITLFASIARLIAAIRADFLALNLSWVFVDFLLWSVIEAGTAVIAACLPFLKPLYTLMADKAKQRNSLLISNVCANPSSFVSRTLSRKQNSGPELYSAHVWSPGDEKIESDSDLTTPVQIRMVLRNGNYERSETSRNSQGSATTEATEMTRKPQISHANFYSQTTLYSQANSQYTRDSREHEEMCLWDPERAAPSKPPRAIICKD